MLRDRVGARRVLHRLRERGVHAVRLRRARQVDRRLGQVQPRLGQPDVLHGVGGGRRDQQRARIGEPDVLGRVHDHPPGDEPGVLPRLEHARQPEQRGVGVRAADALDERARSRRSGRRPAGRRRRPCVCTASAARSRVTSSSPAPCAASTAASRPVSAIRASPPAISARWSSASSVTFTSIPPSPRSGSSSARSMQRPELVRRRAAPAAAAGSATAAACSARSTGSRSWRRSA